MFFRVGQVWKDETEIYFFTLAIFVFTTCSQKGLLIKIENKQANSYFYSFANRKVTNYATLVRKIVEVFSENCKKRVRNDIKTGKKSEETSCYVSNEVGNYEEISSAIRGQWQVETNNHLRDVTLKEDRMRSKKVSKSSDGTSWDIGNNNLEQSKLSEQKGTSREFRR